MTEDHEGLGGDPAAAFEALRAEVALLRAALEGLTTTAPDYSPTLAAIAGSLAAMEAHPALRLTPQDLASQVRQASEAAQRELSDTIRHVGLAAHDLRGVLEGHRTRQVQNYWLAVMAGAGAVFGVVLWVCFSGPIARALPAGWSVPERMAAATLRLDRWDAGARLMQSANPQGWARVAEASNLEGDNRAELDECREAARKANRAQRCILSLQPPALRPQ